MKRNLFLGTLLIIFVGSLLIKSEANAKASKAPAIVTNNIEALLFQGYLGRICDQGCLITNDTKDFCCQCLGVGNDCPQMYFLRRPIGEKLTCPPGNE